MRMGSPFSVAFLLGTSLLATVVVSSGRAEAQPTPAQWTFMVYLDGDNNLEADAIDDFLEMAAVGSNTDVKTVVQLDRISGHDTSYGDWTSAKRFYVARGTTPMPADAVQDIGEVNMGDPQTLVDFATWAASNYPAEHYALVLWNHGSGWHAGTRPPNELVLSRAICWDDTSGDVLSTQEVREAFEAIDTAVGRIDLVGFDACLMGMLEVAYEIREHGDVMVGSEELVPSDGWPYDTLLADLVAQPVMSAQQLGAAIVDRYYESYGRNFTLAAIDLTEVQELADQVDALAQTLIDHWDHDQNAVKDAAADLMAQMENAVIHEMHGDDWPGSHGLAIYFPERQSLFDPTYRSTTILFAQDTQWDEFLAEFYGAMQRSWVKTARALSQTFDLFLGYCYAEHIDLYDFCAQLANYIAPGDDYTESLVTNEFIGGGDAQGWQRDDYCWRYQLPFPFPFFGEEKTSVWVCSNGYLDFESDQPEFENCTRGLIANSRIAPLWADLYTDNGNIYIHQPTPNSVCIRWDAEEYRDGGSVNVEVVLHRNGAIKFNYGSVNTTLGAGWVPTIGISNGDGVNTYYSAHDGRSELANADTEVWTPLFALPDADNDGLPDWVETGTGVFVDETDTGTDPSEPDTDGDGLSDGDEVNTHLCDPNVTDTDNDGLEDGEEVDTYGTYPNDDDSDDDGHTDGREVAAGSDPLDPNSVPRVSRSDHSEGGIEKLNPCFIATAAYATPAAEQVGTLLQFRDVYLMTNRAGRVFVRAYYRLSPSVARFIEGRPVAKKLVRGALAPVVILTAAAVDSPGPFSVILALAIALPLTLGTPRGSRVRYWLGMDRKWGDSPGEREPVEPGAGTRRAEAAVPMPSRRIPPVNE